MLQNCILVAESPELYSGVIRMWIWILVTRFGHICHCHICHCHICHCHICHCHICHCHICHCHICHCSGGSKEVFKSGIRQSCSMGNHHRITSATLNSTLKCEKGLNNIYIIQNSEHWLSPTLNCMTRDLLKCFTTQELMRWQQVCAIYEGELKKGSADSPPTNVFSDDEQGNQRWNDLRNRVVEHVSVVCRSPKKYWITAEEYIV